MHLRVINLHPYFFLPGAAAFCHQVTIYLCVGSWSVYDVLADLQIQLKHRKFMTFHFS